MVRTICFGRALGRVLGKALGREVTCDADDDPNGEGPQHLHVSNGKLHLLMRMFTMWMMQLMRSMNNIKKQLLMT